MREREGLSAYVWALARPRGASPRQAIWRTTRRLHEVEVDVALTWLSGGGGAEVHSFASQARTSEGGTHVEGLWEGLAEGLSQIAGRSVHVALARELLGPGLVAVVHAGLYDPRFGGPTRDRLRSPEARAAVRDAIADALPRWCGLDPSLREALLARINPQ